MRTVVKNLPLPMTLFIMKTIFKLPVSAQRFIFKNNTRPRPAQKRWIHNISNQAGLRAAWISENAQKTEVEMIEKEAREADVVFIFAHGGAGRFGHSKMYMDSFIRWIETMKKEQDLKMMILTVKYTLAPEAQYPHQIQSVGAAYQYLMKAVKIDPLKVVFAGDSMGGHLCLSTLYHNIHHPETLKYSKSLPIPGGVVLISPFLIHGLANLGSYQTNKNSDYVPWTMGMHIIQEYIPHDINISLQDPRISPYFASNFKSWLPPHVLVTVGSKEIMADDIKAFTNKIISEGVEDVTLVEEAMTHDWFCVTEVVRDQRALRNAETTMCIMTKRAVDAANAIKKSNESKESTSTKVSMDDKPVEEELKATTAEVDDDDGEEDEDEEAFQDSEEGSDTLGKDDTLERIQVEESDKTEVVITSVPSVEAA